VDLDCLRNCPEPFIHRLSQICMYSAAKGLST
jgi:hypothetical protein